MSECVLCYDLPVSKRCKQCVFQWCKQCHKKLDSCPVCRKKFPKSVFTHFLIFLTGIFYGVSFYFVPFGAFFFVLERLIRNTNEDSSIILIIIIQFIYSLAFIVFTVIIHVYFLWFEDSSYISEIYET